jgi:hypothetical protein
MKIKDYRPYSELIGAILHLDLTSTHGLQLTEETAQATIMPQDDSMSPLQFVLGTVSSSNPLKIRSPTSTLSCTHMMRFYITAFFCPLISSGFVCTRVGTSRPSCKHCKDKVHEIQEKWADLRSDQRKPRGKHLELFVSRFTCLRTSIPDSGPLRMPNVQQRPSNAESAIISAGRPRVLFIVSAIKSIEI